MTRALSSALAGLTLLVAADAARANGRFPSAEQLVVAPDDPAHIAVQVTYGFIRTRDAGASWTWTCEEAAGYGGVLDPAIALLQGGVLIAGVFDGLVVASPDGCDLGLVGGDLAARFFKDVSTSKSDPTRAVAVSTNGLGGNLFDTLLWRTTDVAATWTQVGAALPSNFLALTVDVAPSNEQRIYMSGFVIVASDQYEGALARSSDGGQTWELVTIPGSDNASGPFIGAVDPADPDTVYVRLASDLGVLMVTHDAGDTWQTVFDATGPLLGFALSPDGARVLVGTETDGIHGADAADLSFSPVSPLGVRCLTWAGDVVYACAKEAVAGFTIGKSTDFGATFTALHNLSCLGGPDPACPAGSTITETCPSRWAAQKQLLATDQCAGGTTSSTGAGAGGGSGDGDDGCGCAVASEETSPWPPVWLAALGLVIALPLRLATRAHTRPDSPANPRSG